MISKITSNFLYFFAFSLLISLIACTDSDKPKPETPPIEEETENLTLPAEESYLETGDLNAIKNQGKLRILTMPLNERWLPRRGSSFSREKELAIKLAEHLQLEPVFVHVDSFDELIPALNEGRGDIITANFTITHTRKELVSFTVPLTHSRERLVTRTDDSIKSTKNLNGRKIAYQAKSSYEETIAQLKQKQTQIQTEILPGNLNTDQILDQLASRKIDLTIMDSNTLNVLQSYRDDFKIGLTLSKERALAWAIRKDNPVLLKEVNRFLTHEQLTRNVNTLFTGDLADIKKRKTLRVITRNNAATYFLWRGELLGFEYELAKAFAKQQKLRIEIITAPSHEAQIPMLLEGKGDLIASFMTITDERKAQGVGFSRPHHTASEVIVTRADDNSLKQIEDLAGRSIYVRQSSAYWQTLQKLKNKGIDFKLVSAPETMETEEIIARVASGKYDLTLADNHLLDIELTWRNDIQAAFPIGEPQGNAWAMRPGNTQLINAVNRFLKKEHRSLF